MNPDKELEKLNKKRAKMAGYKRWVRRGRWLFSIMVAILLTYSYLSYTIYTVQGRYNPASQAPQSPIYDVQPEDMLLLQKLNLWRDPKVGDVVIYRKTGTDTAVEGTLVGRIAGLPGENIKRLGPTMTVNGRDALPVGFSVGLGEKVKAGDTIPDGQYMIITDTDDMPFPDSRTLGYIPRGDILYRVSTNITLLFGRAQAVDSDNLSDK